MDLNATSSIITGGASGIGLATAKHVASLGGRVVIADLNEEKGKAVAEELGGVFVKTDVSDEAQAQAAVDAALELGPLRTVLNSAGLGSAGRTVDREGNPFNLDNFSFVIKVNLIGTFNVTRLAASAMSKQDPVDEDGQRGSIVNLASVAAFDGQIGQAAYAASKAGAVNLVRALAIAWAGESIRVNGIAPSLVDTKMTKVTMDNDERRDRALSRIPLGRFGSVEEMAGVALFLASPLSTYICGQTLIVDGGLTLT